MTSFAGISIKHALDNLAKLDSDVAKAIALIGYPPPRAREPGFGTLGRIVLAQQISVKAADSIEAKLLAMTGQWDVDNFCQFSIEDLRSCGLSQRKGEYLSDLARQIASGAFDLAGLATLSDKQAIAKITALRGFGQWSAEIYCMFALNRPDIMAADDIALQQSMAYLKNLDARPSAATLRKLTDHWSPYRTDGAVFLWHYYRGRPT